MYLVFCGLLLSLSGMLLWFIYEVAWVSTSFLSMMEYCFTVGTYWISFIHSSGRNLSYLHVSWYSKLSCSERSRTHFCMGVRFHFILGVVGWPWNSCKTCEFCETELSLSLLALWSWPAVDEKCLEVWLQFSILVDGVKVPVCFVTPFGVSGTHFSNFNSAQLGNPAAVDSTAVLPHEGTLCCIILEWYH